jgi:hypothetical protein
MKILEIPEIKKEIKIPEILEIKMKKMKILEIPEIKKEKIKNLEIKKNHKKME